MDLPVVPGLPASLGLRGTLDLRALLDLRDLPIVLQQKYCFQGTNAGFQRIAGSPGIDSNVIPYVTAGAGSIVGFSASININNLPAAIYTINICRNVPTNLTTPSSSYILSTITLTTTDKITGTMVFSIKPTDSGAGQIQVFNPTPAVGPATVTWTSITTGNPVARGDAISLYITPGITASAVYSIFLITDI